LTQIPQSTMRARLILIALALVAGLAPLPPATIERVYSTSLYPAIQRVLTPLSNLAPFALFDVTLVLAALALGAIAWRRRRDGWRRGIARGLMDVAGVAAAVYLAFLAAWGLNYRRVPLEAKLEFDRARVDAEAVHAFARRVIEELNRLAPAAHARPWPPLGQMREAIGLPAERAARAMALVRGPVPGRPKGTMLTWYFREAGIDGMTNPFLLETLLNTDLLPMELPFVVAHEWAHLAGFADESEANFVAWLTGMMGDEQAQYSAWICIYPIVIGNIGRERVALMRTLSEEVRRDLRAIVARQQQASATVERVATRVYDQYLKANRVPEGIRSYQGVLALIVGTTFAEDGKPRLRTP
jgi:hypothetical protein